MRAASRASESAAADFLEVVPAGALQLDSEERVLSANSEAVVILDRGDLEGLSVRDLLGPAAHKLASSDEPGEVVVNSGERTLLVRSTPLEEGGTIMLLVDVTEYERVRAKAEEATRTRTEFLARLSHEIRSALASMIGFAEILKDNVSEVDRELADTIMLSGRHLLQTLNSVLDLASLEYGEKEVALTGVDVVARVRDRVKVFQPAAERKGLTLAFEPDVDSAIADLNPIFLDRVVHNLIDNAIKYTPSGKVEVDVEVRDEKVWIYVADTGRGIDRSFLPRLFEPFEREQTEQESAADGVGLGLHITKYLTELMEGRITACSTKGEGSTFTLTFPIGNESGEEW